MTARRVLLAAPILGILVVTASLLGSVVPAVGITAAYAEEPTNDPTILAPSLSLSMLAMGTYTHVCFTGSAAAAGSWSMGVSGERYDTNHTLPSQISFGAGLPPSTYFHQCYDVTLDGYQYGSFYAYGLFEGGTSGTTVARPGSLSGVTQWYPLGSDIHFQTTGG